MSKIRKILTLAACAVLLVCVTVAGTVAYLKAQDTVVNTFTVGKVEINLDETDVDLNGVKESDNRVKANEYKLMPGHTYTKDPTVTVKTGSEDAYVRMLVTVTDHADLLTAVKSANTETAQYSYTVNDVEYVALHMLVSGWEDDVWVYEGVKTNADGTVTYEFRYFETTGAAVLDPLFTTITLPGTVNNDQLANLDDVQVNVVAQAIQADGFVDADAAWDAFSK